MRGRFLWVAWALVGAVILGMVWAGLNWYLPIHRLAIGKQCYGQVMRLSMSMQEYLDGDTNQALPAGDTPLRAFAGSASELVCPADRRWSHDLKFEELTGDMIAYETWSRSELQILKAVFTGQQGGMGKMPVPLLLIWEKNPNHEGKRNIGIVPGAAQLLADEQTFREMTTQARQYIEGLKSTRREESGTAQPVPTVLGPSCSLTCDSPWLDASFK